MPDKQVFAFVLMPFDKKFNDFYEFGIKETANSLDIIAERVDEQIFSENILERIYNQIDKADIIIADLSEKNPNVFYEVGYAHAKKKICLHLTQSVEDIPFDLKHHRHIVYNQSLSSLKTQLLENLNWAKQEVINSNQNLIRFEIKKIDGDMEKGVAWTKDIIKFNIDIFNESEEISHEIEAIHLYSHSDWSITQNENTCDVRKSDLDEYSYLFLLDSPKSKLAKNSWLPLSFKASKYKYHKPSKNTDDIHNIKGDALLKLKTSLKDFEYKIDIDVKCEYFEIPF